MQNSDQGHWLWLQDSEVGFDIDIPITGDIIIALWFSDHKGEWDSPELAVSFHTLFDEVGLLRMTNQELDIPPKSSLGKSAKWQTGFFMDIIVEASSAAESHAQCVQLHNTLWSQTTT